MDPDGVVIGVGDDRIDVAYDAARRELAARIGRRQPRKVEHVRQGPHQGEWLQACRGEATLVPEGAGNAPGSRKWEVAAVLPIRLRRISLRAGCTLWMHGMHQISQRAVRQLRSD